VLAACCFSCFSAVAAEPDKEGFVSLFDGKSLAGWQGAVRGYQVKDGVLASKPGIGGNLYTKDEYGDFIFRFEFKLSPNANSGIGLRTPTHGDAAYVGMEAQVLDDSGSDYKNLHEYQYHGSIYGVVPAKRGHLKPVGEWNSEEITCQGRHVKVVLNGVTIVDADLDQAAPGGKTIDGKPHPGLARNKGHIGLLGHTNALEFRNISIKPL
jgi:hypothetical protein